MEAVNWTLNEATHVLSTMFSLKPIIWSHRYHQRMCSCIRGVFNVHSQHPLLLSSASHLVHMKWFQPRHLSFGGEEEAACTIHLCQLNGLHNYSSNLVICSDVKFGSLIENTGEIVILLFFKLYLEISAYPFTSQHFAILQETPYI